MCKALKQFIAFIDQIWKKWVVYKLGALAHFVPWVVFGLGIISTFWAISSLYMLNWFRYFLIYILRQNVSKSDKKGFELYQVFTHNFLCQDDKIFINIFELYLVFLWQNVTVLANCILLMHQMYHSVKMVSISFFLIFWDAKIQPSFKMTHYKHWFFI